MYIRLSVLGLLASTLVADTLILRDGTRLDGTYLGGTARQVNFLERNNNSRRTIDVRDVREVMFGTDTTSMGSNSGSGWGTGSGTNTQTNAGSWDRFESLRRLHDSVLNVMNTTRLSANHRQLLNNAVNIMRTTLDSGSTDDRAIMRDLRRPFDDIRFVANSGALRAEDRTILLDTIEQIRTSNRQDRSNNGIFNNR
jgi:hypothetical protein